MALLIVLAAVGLIAGGRGLADGGCVVGKGAGGGDCGAGFHFEFAGRQGGEFR